MPRLESEHRRIVGPHGGDEVDVFDLVLHFRPGAFERGDTLVVESVMQLEPLDPWSVELVERIGSRTALRALDGIGATRWVIPSLRCRFEPFHANDGPVAAYLERADGSVVEVEVKPATSREASGGGIVHGVSARGSSGSARSPDRSVAIVPYPAIVAEGTVTRTERVVLDPAARPEIVALWRSVRALDERLVGGSTLSDEGLPVRCRSVADLDGEAYRWHARPDEITVSAGGVDGFRRAFQTLAAFVRSGTLPTHVEDAPVWRRRVVHLDLARRWFDPETVLRLIDLAAVRKLSTVHLHLTDDEAWRVPISAFTELGRIGGVRGPGLAVGAQLGSGAAPYGRAYTTAEIGEWVARARDVGIELVPEIDVPGHCHAALTAMPSLRDPADRSTAVSVQGFGNNTLVPGHPLTDAFVETVFGELADLFPDATHLHVGGDEVPDRSWEGSPLAREFARSRGLSTAREIERRFVAEIVDRVRSSTGRRIAGWEEVAASGALVAGEDHVVAWTSATSASAIVATGLDVVVSPGTAYYLDMAVSPDWVAPGASWAGTVPLSATIAFDPNDGIPTPDRVLGLQACVWAEHLVDAATMDALVFPRLDAIAERGWRGAIHGGEPGLATRAAALPRWSRRSGGAGSGAARMGD